MDRYQFTDQVSDCEVDGQTQHHKYIAYNAIFLDGISLSPECYEAELKWCVSFDSVVRDDDIVLLHCYFCTAANFIIASLLCFYEKKKPAHENIYIPYLQHEVVLH